MTSVAWILYWGGALCRTHLSGVTGDYDWVATCRATEVIQSGALITTMTIVALHPTQPPPRPQLFSSLALLLWCYMFLFPKPNTLHKISHTSSVSRPVTHTCSPVVVHN